MKPVSLKVLPIISVERGQKFYSGLCYDGQNRRYSSGRLVISLDCILRSFVVFSMCHKIILLTASYRVEHRCTRPPQPCAGGGTGGLTKHGGCLANVSAWGIGEFLFFAKLP